MAISFGMNAVQSAAANAAMSAGTTFTGFHIFISALAAFVIVSFILACLITGYNHFAENDIPIDKFLKLIVFLAVLFVGFAIFLVI